MQRARVVSVLVMLAALALLAGCGAAPAPGTVTRSASAGDQACRDRWHGLTTVVAAQARRGALVKRAFSSRWESIAAGIAYRESTATADQCGKELTDQQAAITAQRALVRQVLPFDMESRLATVREGRRAYAAAHPKRKESRAVRRAYRTLETTSARADRAIAPAVVQLAGTDPDRASQIRSRMRDLRLLASTSAAWQACRNAQGTIDAYQHPAKHRTRTSGR